MTEKDKEFIELFVKVELFAFNDNMLRSLVNMPCLEKCLKAEFCYNKIKTGLHELKSFTNLRNLKLVGNRIDSFEEIKALGKACPLLQELDLSANPISLQKDYRDLVFQYTEGIELLDKMAITEHEKRSDGNSCDFNPHLEHDDERDEREVGQIDWIDDATSSSGSEVGNGIRGAAAAS